LAAQGATVSKKKDKLEKTAAQSTFDDGSMLAISRALSDPRRVKVLRKIATCAGTACMDLRESLAINPATLSHHIKQLESAGLIETARDGKFVRATLRRKTWKTYLGHLKKFAA
jgi:ArsR family transcriptional regulator